MSPLKIYHPHHRNSNNFKERGFSLIELMITITIGLVIVGALAILFANNSRTRSEIEKSSRRIDSGRFALETIQAEIQNSGYFAEFDPRTLNLPATMPDPCLTSEEDLKNAMRLHVQGYNDVANAVLSCLSDVKEGTDILVTRRANGCINGSANCSPLESGDFGFQASSCNKQNKGELYSSNVDNHYRLSSTIASLDRTKRDCTTAADVRRYLVKIFYISKNDKSNDGIPTLKLAELSGGNWKISSLAQGIENMQIEYGLDKTNNKGSPDIYTPSPQNYLNCTGATCVQQWASAVTAKVSLLGRNIDPSGTQDKKIYTLGKFNDGPDGASGSNKTLGPFNDKYKRNVYQATVRMQNPSYRNATGL